MEDHMPSIVRLATALSVLVFIASCGLGTPEQRGDAAYRKAQKLEGNEKRLQQKMAYTMYQRAIESHPDKISNKIRGRFLELSLSRAKMVLDEGNAGSDAIPLFQNDIEKYLTADAPQNLRQEYALFLIQLADSFAVKERTDQALATIDKAIAFAADPTSLSEKKKTFVGRVAKENFELAQVEYENGKSNKDFDALVRAEYYVQAAMLLDPGFEGAAKLLSDIRRENVGTYSAFIRVIQNIPDSAIFRKVNKYDILLAIPVIGKGATVGLSVNIYNYSYNPLRMKSEHFFLVDKSGKKYQAKPAKLADPEILDQEHEAKYKLSFPKPAGEIAKLVYENGEHYTEKCFF
jgi:hypothetical protein